MLVNVVSQIPAAIWDREVPPESSLEYQHTRDPVSADIHVIYGLREKLSIPNAPENVIFVASEPPEIRRYNLTVLESYRFVLGPSFPYLKGLLNFHPISAVAPWWVGSFAGGTQHYEHVSDVAGFSRAELSEGFSPGVDKVAAIVSNKAHTPLQQQRLRLVDYLLGHLADFEAYGLEYLPVQDKSDVLAKYRYHLAVENSIHRGYWTEKLSDPVLLDNFLFYAGDPSLREKFVMSSIREIDPWDLEGTYSAIAKSLEAGVWATTREAMRFNRSLLLDRLSFHRQLEALATLITPKKFFGRGFNVPPQHPRSLLKKLFDPLYRRAKRVISFHHI